MWLATVSILQRVHNSRYYGACRGRRSGDLITDFPVQAERIGEAAEAPAVFLADGKNLGCAGGEGLGEDGIGIGDREDHADGTAADRIWALGLVWRVLAEPELGSVYGEPHDDASAGIFETIDFLRSEGGGVEGDGFGGAGNREPGGD